MNSVIALIIQCVGIALITVLLFFVQRSIKSETLRYWSAAWAALSLSLFSLIIAFNAGDFAQPFLGFYFLGEYIFGYLLIAGCRNFTSGENLTSRSFYWLIAAVLIAFTVPILNEDFNNFFFVHSYIIASLFAISFFTLRPLNKPLRKNFGLKVSRLALAFLAFVFFQYSAIFLTRGTILEIPLFQSSLAYNSILDLFLETLLGFGMIMILLEEIRLDIFEANQKLREAHEKLRQFAQTDPLTTAFNRHAFYGFLQKGSGEQGEISGCVGVFDIDNLKPINDRFGHDVGDKTIRAVVRAIRVLIRAEDLLFRWGGDEFFVIMVSMSAKGARARMKKLDELLMNISLGENDCEVLNVTVSSGFADFTDFKEVEQSIKIADSEMYQFKQKRKDQETVYPPAIFAPQNPSISLEMQH